MNQFKEKLKSITGKDVVLAMIAGLKKEWVKVDMGSFGHVNPNNGICYGCAATNAICELTQSNYVLEPWEMTQDDGSYLLTFESAVDFLRCGSIHSYNMNVTSLDLTNLLLPNPPHDIDLPILTDNNYKEKLQHYKRYAKWIK